MVFQVTDLAADAVLTEAAAKKCPKKSACERKTCCKASCKRTTSGPSTCPTASLQCPKRGTLEAVEQLLKEVQELAERRELKATITVRVSAKKKK
jgi:hypothetical protein